MVNVIQRCFDDNNDDKGDEQKAQRSKNNSSESRTSQEFKNQEGFKISRIKIKIKDSRFKNQEKA